MENEIISNLRCSECRCNIDDYRPDLNAFDSSGMCAKCFKKDQQHAGHEWQKEFGAGEDIFP